MQARPPVRGPRPVRAVPMSSVVTPIVEHDAAISPPPWELAESERQSMIAEAAYYRSVARGFAPGHELDDWLAAEAEVEALLQAQGAGPDRD